MQLKWERPLILKKADEKRLKAAEASDLSKKSPSFHSNNNSIPAMPAIHIPTQNSNNVAGG